MINIDESTEERRRKLKQYVASNPAMSRASIAREIGISKQSLNNILNRNGYTYSAATTAIIKFLKEQDEERGSKKGESPVDSISVADLEILIEIWNRKEISDVTMDDIVRGLEYLMTLHVKCNE